MRSHIQKILTTAFLLHGFCVSSMADNWHKGFVVSRVFSYASSVVASIAPTDSIVSYTYIKYRISTDRRNFTLLAVPTMYAIAHSGERKHVGETYDKVEISKEEITKATRLLQQSTIPHNRKTMPVLVKYLTPDIYGQTLIGDYMLSPFNRSNRRFYNYRTISFMDGSTTITFKPKVKSTQLVSGTAEVDPNTGRIKSAVINGEYDMIDFTLNVIMGSEGRFSLHPAQCVLNARFSFVGNKISSQYEATYRLPPIPDDSISNQADTTLMSKVRPYPLTQADKESYRRHYLHNEAARKGTTATDSTTTKRSSKRLWENLGETLFTRIRSDFGGERQGSIRLNPILNPLYLGYSGRRGLTYKFDVRMTYAFSTNSQLATRVKAGYSFKQKHLFYTIPVTYTFNNRHNGFIELEYEGGKRITNSTVADAIKGMNRDSIDWNAMDLEYFKDTKLRLDVHYDLSPKLGLQAGISFHRRTATDRASYATLGQSPHYTSAAPLLEIEYRPCGYNGPIVTANYERGIKGFCNAGIEYERYEFDAQYKHHMRSLSLLQMRAGVGFYSHKGDDWYFLDYSNFRENNIPGGWNDDWANEFELLNSNWYNASSYYIRSNLTYESPILIAAWIPFVGRYIEKERIYINALSVQRLHPYVEYGYGIRTRLFSAGMFLAQSNGRFDGFGLRFGFELFRQW